MDYDVAVIGAGAAGIAASRMLFGKKRSVILLEASGRIGGRAWTQHLRGLPLDMGCGWLHSARRNPLVELAAEAGFAVERGPTAWQTQWRDIGFSADDQAAASSAWEDFVDRLQSSPPPSDRASDALEPNGPWNAYCQSLSGYLNGASLEQLSVKDFLAYDTVATDDNWRVRDGYGGLIGTLLPEKLPLRLSTRVRRILLSPDGVELETDRGRLTAGAVIVTVSTNVLAQQAIRFDRDMDEHLQAAAQLPLGLAEKIVFELHGNHGLEPETHLLGNPRSDSTGSYYLQPLGRPMIEGFFGAKGAALFRDEGLQAACDFALEELASLIGNGIRGHARFLAASSWASTDGIGGSYSHARPGHAEARAVLARPVDNRIFFAGEATHATDFSTAHGAWESGIRAAREVLAKPA